MGFVRVHLRAPERERTTRRQEWAKRDRPVAGLA
jgi:hypothetical protein